MVWMWIPFFLHRLQQQVCRIKRVHLLLLLQSTWISIWVWSRRGTCLVTWFCYQKIAKPGNKTGPPSWPYPHHQWVCAKFSYLLTILLINLIQRHQSLMSNVTTFFHIHVYNQGLYSSYTTTCDGEGVRLHCPMRPNVCGSWIFEIIISQWNDYYSHEMATNLTEEILTLVWKHHIVLLVSSTEHVVVWH